jgi:CHAD domain-containing protein
VRLADAAARPRLREAAWEPCRSALPGLVRDAWKRAKKRGRHLRKHADDEDYHDVRKRAKAVRYAAEAVMPVLGRRAQRFATRARKVQEVLGTHQDAVVAADEVARVAAAFPHDPPFQDAAKRLRRRLRKAAAKSRNRFFKAWRKLDRKALRRWLKP